MLDCDRRAPVIARRLLALLPVALLCCGCSLVQAREDGAAHSARRFGSALRTGATPAACAGLSVRARSEAAGTEPGCVQGLPALRLTPGGRVARTDVAGRQARVVMERDTLFLSLFPGGWKVTAAGCEPRGEDLPYDCDLQGS